MELRMSRIEVKMDELEFRIEDRLKEHRSETFIKFDSWAGELEAAREDRILSTKKLDGHEKRIKKLEKVQN